MGQDRSTTSAFAFGASVEIRAEPGRVFDLVSDLRRKARLNPNITVIRVELEGEEPIRAGSVFYHRFQMGSRIAEYRSRVLRFEPPRLIESRGETAVPFEVRVIVEPTEHGCRLTQSETLHLGPDEMDWLEPVPGTASVRDAFRLLRLFPALRPLGAHVRALQRERIERRLAGELTAWLERIKTHLENEGAPAAMSGARARSGDHT